MHVVGPAAYNSNKDRQKIGLIIRLWYKWVGLWVPERGTLKTHPFVRPISVRKHCPPTKMQIGRLGNTVSVAKGRGAAKDKSMQLGTTHVNLNDSIKII